MVPPSDARQQRRALETGRATRRQRILHLVLQSTVQDPWQAIMVLQSTSRILVLQSTVHNPPRQQL